MCLIRGGLILGDVSEELKVLNRLMALRIKLDLGNGLTQKDIEFVNKITEDGM
jgi:hypothetical protein